MNEFIMITIMFIAGLLSSMSIWVDKIQDINITLNDCYMSILMIGWTYLLIGIYEKNVKMSFISFLLVVIMFVFIRLQLFINTWQYISGMITHHSMGVFMSRKILEKNPNEKIQQIAKNIISSQEKEKELLNRSY